MAVFEEHKNLRDWRRKAAGRGGFLCFDVFWLWTFGLVRDGTFDETRSNHWLQYFLSEMKAGEDGAQDRPLPGRTAENRGGCYYAGIPAPGITAVYLGYGWNLAHLVWEKDYVIAAEKDVDGLCIAMPTDSGTNLFINKNKLAIL